MLLSLYIRNFALIEEVNIDFKAGFNVLTGETGAGKSILIDAVNVVLGGRGSNDFIRSGEEKASVSAVFDVSGLNELNILLSDMGIDVEEDLLLHLSRELSATGKNICRINGRIVNLSMYRETGQYLIDIHGQHDHHSLLSPDKHLDLLDRFGPNELDLFKDQIIDIYTQLKENNDLLRQITGGEKDRARQKDIFKFQLEEIERADLNNNEDIELEEEKKILINAEKLANLSNQAYLLLYKGNNYPAALDQLNMALNNLKDIEIIDSSIENVKRVIEEATYQIEEASREVYDYYDKIDSNSSRLEFVNDRLDLIKNIKKKYGDTIEEIFKFREEVAAELELIESGDEKVLVLQEAITNLKNDYYVKALQISDLRKRTSERLEKEVGRELQELLMPQVIFNVAFSETGQPTKKGNDKVEFQFSPNPGEPLKAISKIASGGELSRIMLALKSILAKLDDVPTLIFDEIDSGLGGRAAHAVAEKLGFLGKTRQVICVTHSPQVASFGEHHFYIEKEVIGQRTLIKMKALNKKGRINELARMLGGKNLTELTIQHATELLELEKKDN